MGALAEAPVVVRKSTRIFVTKEDVAALLGCGKSKAYDIVREVNGLAKKKGNLSRPPQHRHLKRKDSIRFLVFLDFSLIFIRSG